MNEEKRSARDRSASLQKTLGVLAEYRKPMKVTEVIICRSPYHGEVGYYVCPRCKVSMEREFCAFCDRCGQKLGWRGYREAKRIYSGGAKTYS